MLCLASSTVAVEDGIQKMVKKGSFTVELVDAETKIPFREHTCEKDGQLYVEVEPNAEYLIKISSDTERPVSCCPKVDGEPLGYIVTLMKRNGPSYRGLWSSDGTRDITWALRCQKTPVVKADSPCSVSPSPFWTGKVEVELYEAIALNTVEPIQSFQPSWIGGDVTYTQGVSDVCKKTGVKSVTGSIAETTKRGITRVYAKGRYLETISLNYCTTVGLIHVGVLPKPPMWDFHRLQHPRKRKICNDDDPPHKVVTPQRIRISQEGGDALIAPKEFDLFDLTCVSDDDGSSPEKEMAAC